MTREKEEKKVIEDDHIPLGSFLFFRSQRIVLMLFRDMACALPHSKIPNLSRRAIRI